MKNIKNRYSIKPFQIDLGTAIKVVVQWGDCMQNGYDGGYWTKILFVALEVVEGLWYICCFEGYIKLKSYVG